MLRRLLGCAALAVMAGCGDDPAAEGATARPGDAAEERASRFEVSVDTQRIATPDSEVAPSENAPD